MSSRTAVSRRIQKNRLSVERSDHWRKWNSTVAEELEKFLPAVAEGFVKFLSAVAEGFTELTSVVAGETTIFPSAVAAGEAISHLTRDPSDRRRRRKI